MSIKVTVNLPEQTVEAIKEIASARGTTVTEALRQVIETQRFLDEETQSGKELLIKNPADQTAQRVVFNTLRKASSAAR
jgi:hypothetical protein